VNKIKRWFSDIFEPEQFNDMDTTAIEQALNDQNVRSLWIHECFEEIKRINMEVDKRLLHGPEYGLTDLCARRKAYQDILEYALSARRQLQTQIVRPNPKAEVSINLDRVTA
jgi:hypothetical protein